MIGLQKNKLAQIEFERFGENWIGEELNETEYPVMWDYTVR